MLPAVPKSRHASLAGRAIKGRCHCQDSWPPHRQARLPENAGRPVQPDAVTGRQDRGAKPCSRRGLQYGWSPVPESRRPHPWQDASGEKRPVADYGAARHARHGGWPGQCRRGSENCRVVILSTQSPVRPANAGRCSRRRPERHRNRVRAGRQRGSGFPVVRSGCPDLSTIAAWRSHPLRQGWPERRCYVRQCDIGAYSWHGRRHHRVRRHG